MSKMSADSSTDGNSRAKRPILGDVTNQQGKRAWASISDNLDVKIGDGYNKDVDFKACLGAENIVQEKFRANCVVISDSDKGKRVCISPRPCSEINSLRGNMVSGISKIPSDVPIIDLVEDGEGRVTSQIAESDVEGEQLVTVIPEDDGPDVGVANLVTDKQASAGCSRFPMSQCSKSFELERCIGLKDDGSSNSNGGIELMKACSCPFCTKAAYIWSDLYYQDMKGRIAALKKSQKEAGILVQRSCRDKGIDKHGQGSSNKNLKLESDLMSNWRSLFVHMENIFVRESTQLEASLLALKDLRETCKMDLEIINAKRSENQ